MSVGSSREGRSKEDKEEEQEQNGDHKDINVHYNKKLSNPSSSLHKTILNKLGPGIITGASDADPSGIATYSQA